VTFLRASAVLLVGAFFALATVLLAAIVLLPDLAPDDKTYRPVLSGALAVGPFVAAFLVAAIGFTVLRMRDETRTVVAPARLAEAVRAFEQGRTDEAFLLLRKACEPLRGDAPSAGGDFVSAIASALLPRLPEGSDAELVVAVKDLCESPLPVESARLSLLLAYVDGHADAAESRAANTSANT